MEYQPGQVSDPVLVEEFRRIADSIGFLYRGEVVPAPTSVTGPTYTVQPADTILLIDATSNNVVITHTPLAAATGRLYRFKRIDNVPANAVTVDGSGSETIDGDDDFVLYPYEDIDTYAGSATDWSIL